MLCKETAVTNPDISGLRWLALHNFLPLQSVTIECSKNVTVFLNIVEIKTTGYVGVSGCFMTILC